ncbi:hypothetical protein QBC39DRAFT_111023 [Podospora conica]|nr:hypothetical protein QBC39DRAFT_111023 [Schizothecium conicum]
MKTTLSIILASAALATAGEVESKPFTCKKADAAYCASDKSLDTDIILRCTSIGTVPQPGRCSNNLAGEPPIGSGNGGRCWQSSPTAGDAACEKNCIVYAPAGSFPLPISVCTPTYTASSTTTKPTSSTTTTKSTTKSTSTKAPTTTTTAPPTTKTTTKTKTKSSDGTTTTRTYTHTTDDCTTGTYTKTKTKSWTTDHHHSTSTTKVWPTKTTTTARPPPVTAGAAVNGVVARGVVGVVAVVGGLLL